MNSGERQQNLLIVGASGRAAAFSAIRAGFRPFCADLFADWDLSQRCETVRLSLRDYPEQLVELAAAAPPGPWIYTGAIENYPEIVEQISRHRPLWGNSAEVLRRVRDPFVLAEVLRRNSLPVPEVRQTAAGLSRDGRWLIKPLHSAGGIGIRPLTSRCRVPASLAGSDPVERVPQDTGRRGRGAYYLQELIDGIPCAAIYVASNGHADLLGVTRQLVGERAFHAGRFAYCGSIGPLPLDQQTRKRFQRLGEVLASEFGLVGLFGVDGVLKEGWPYPVEVNPRWTASVEVLEYATGFSAISLHAEAWEAKSPRARVPGSSRILGAADIREYKSPRAASPADKSPRVTTRGLSADVQQQTDVSPFPPADPPVYVAKAILYADRRRQAPEPRCWGDLGVWTAREGDFSPGRGPDEFSMPPLADIPRAGEVIPAGRPMISILVRGGLIEHCLSRLREQAQRIRERFHPL